MTNRWQFAPAKLPVMPLQVVWVGSAVRWAGQAEAGSKPYKSEHWRTYLFAFCLAIYINMESVLFAQLEL